MSSSNRAQPTSDDDLIIVESSGPSSSRPPAPAAQPQQQRPQRTQTRRAPIDVDLLELSSSDDEFIIDDYVPAPGGGGGALRYREDEAMARRLQAELDNYARDNAAARAAGIGAAHLAPPPPVTGRGGRGGLVRARLEELGGILGGFGPGGGARMGEGPFGPGGVGVGGVGGGIGGMFMNMWGFGGDQEFFGQGEVGIPPGLQGVIGRDAAWGGAARVRAARKWVKAMSYPGGGAKPAPGFSRDIVPPPEEEEEMLPPPPPQKKRKGARARKPKVPEPADSVCASCLELLVLDPDDEKKRPWVLACGHVVCGGCLEEAKERKMEEERQARRANWGEAPLNEPRKAKNGKGKGKGRQEVITIDEDDESSTEEELKVTAPPLANAEEEDDDKEPDTDTESDDIPLATVVTRHGANGITRRSQAGTSTRSGASHAKPAPPRAKANAKRAKSQTPGLDLLKAANKEARDSRKGSGKRKKEDQAEVEEDEEDAVDGVVRGWTVCPVVKCHGAGGDVTSTNYSGPFKLYF